MQVSGLGTLYSVDSDPADDGLTIEKCARCGRTILTTDTGYTTHQGADGHLSRGCRAASFTVENGWDDNLKRSWLATRPRR